MSSTFLREYIDGGWRKIAAAQQTAPTEEIEHAFADQAYQFIANKATPLMKTPYRVGFEIVFKNDQNTRMVGIFIFRVGPSLFYAPAFFLNGTIKGTDLLHRMKEKRFIPLTPDWCDYVISLASTQSEGASVPMADRANVRNTLELQDIVSPPDVTKMAKELLNDIDKTPRTFAPLLEQFMQEEGTDEMLQKLAKAADMDPRFAEALASLNLENLRPKPRVKQASKRIGTALRIHTNLLTNEHVKQAKESDMERGFSVEDLREDGLVNPVVYKAHETHLSGITLPGKHSLLTRDGSFKDVLVGYHGSTPRNFQTNGSGMKLSGGCCESSVSASFGSSTSLGIYDLDGQGYDHFYDPKLYGNTDVNPFDPKTLGVDVPETGKSYVIYDTRNNRFLGRPLTVKEVEENMGTKIIRYHHSWTDGTPDSLLLNPDFDGVSHEEGIIGGCCRFLPVKAEKEKRSDGTEGSHLVYNSDISPGDSYAIDQMIYGQHFKRASVMFEPHTEDFVLKFGHHDNRYRLPEVKALGALLLDGAMRESAAGDLLKEAREKGKVEFYYHPPKHLIKAAYNQQFTDWPEYNEFQDSDFGVQGEYPTQELIPVDRMEPAPIEPRLGDGLKHEAVNEDNTPDMSTMGPAELYAMSKETGMDNLFQHGAVGELTQTFDSMGMMDKYLPDLEQALDRLGRLLFLFYWKPEDFAAAYGADDQSQLENKFLSNFKAFGQLVLELLKKNKSLQQGNVSLV